MAASYCKDPIGESHEHYGNWIPAMENRAIFKENVLPLWKIEQALWKTHGNYGKHEQFGETGGKTDCTLPIILMITLLESSAVQSSILIYEGVFENIFKINYSEQWNSYGNVKEWLSHNGNKCLSHNGIEET